MDQLKNGNLNLPASKLPKHSDLPTYFEPTEDEREQGLKMPTVAHKAIASLVKNGSIRMILTTNFDRLLETALGQEGVTSDVISTDDALKGVIPYVHSRCTIVKVNGDYMDVRIKNTSEELAGYSEGLKACLDRILDEFGLIVCGWSGQYDSALKDAILRCPSRRFTTYWATKGEPNDEASRLIKHRQAEVISIESADKFFSQVLEKVESLRESERPHPTSTKVAVETVKRYIAEERHRIRLHDFFHEETERLYSQISSPRFDTHTNNLTKDIFQQRLREYEALGETLISMSATLSYHDKGANVHLLTKCIERLLAVPKEQGSILLINLQFYPALLFCYASGIAALAANNYEHLAAVLMRPKTSQRGEKIPAIEVCNAWQVFSYQYNMHKWVPRQNAEREYTPENNHIFDVLREPLRSYLSDDKKYEETFDIFEYLLGLTYLDLTLEKESSRAWAPWGCFIWRYRRHAGDTPIDEFFNSGLTQGDDWPLLKSGFFKGSKERVEFLTKKYTGFLQLIRRE